MSLQINGSLCTPEFVLRSQSSTFTALPRMENLSTQRKQPILCVIEAKCPVNFFLASSGSLCQPCPRGSVALGNTTSCTQCVNLLPSSDGRCKPCPAGQGDTDGSYVCRQCPQGTYSSGKSSLCQFCPLGSVPSVEQTSCEQCSNTTYAPQGSEVCLECPAGSACNGSHVEPCPVGFVSPTGASLCTPCAAGTFANDATQQCEQCPSGTFAEEMSPTCTPCKAGNYSDSYGSPRCQRCAAGRFSSTDQATKCSECGVGEVSPPGASTCTTCAEGWRPSLDRSTCVACDAGTFSPAAATTCSACTAGKYAGPAAGECLACPFGFVAPQSQAAECEVCVAGRFAAVTGGTAATDGGGTQCEACPLGKVSDEGRVECQNCSPGHIASANRTVCLPCAAGRVALPGEYVCTECTRGRHANDDQSTCIACSSGYVASEPGQSQCQQCPGGRFAALSGNSPATAGGGTQCSTCGIGRYSEPGATSCQQCPDGTVPSADQTTCVPCAAGFFSKAGDASCSTCQPGEFQPEPRQDRCRLCAAGSYSAERNATECIPCPPGFMSARDGADECDPCEPGSFSQTENQRYCELCPPGTSQPQQGRASCRPCERGLVALQPGQEQCTLCSDGSFASGDGQRCLDCARVSAELCRDGRRSFLPDFWSEFNIKELFINSTVTQDGRVMTEQMFHKCPERTCAMSADGEPRCNGARHGPMCALCEDNYYPSTDGACFECLEPTVAWVSIILILTALLVFISLVVGSSKGNRSVTMSVFRIAINFTQLTASVGAFAVQAPEVIGSMLGFTAATDGVSLDSGFIQCEIPNAMYVTVFGSFLLPLLVVVIPVVVVPVVIHCSPLRWFSTLVSKCKKPQTNVSPVMKGEGGRKGLQHGAVPQRRRVTSIVAEVHDLYGSFKQQQCQSCAGVMTSVTCSKRGSFPDVLLLWKTTCIVVLFLLYMQVTKSFLRVFNIYPRRIYGDFWLRDDLSLAAFTSTHTIVMIFAGLGLALYTIGIPAIAFCMIRRQHRRGRADVTKRGLHSPRFRRVFGFLYLGYDLNRDLYWWEGLVLLRKVLMAGLAVFSVSPYLQSYIALVALTCFLVIHVHARPFTIPAMNALEALSLSASTFTQMGSIIYNQDVLDPILVTLALVGLNVITLAVFVVSFVLSLQPVRTRLSRVRRCSRLMNAFNERQPPAPSHFTATNPAAPESRHSGWTKAKSLLGALSAGSSNPLFGDQTRNRNRSASVLSSGARSKSNNLKDSFRFRPDEKSARETHSPQHECQQDDTSASPANNSLDASILTVPKPSPPPEATSLPVPSEATDVPRNRSSSVPEESTPPLSPRISIPTRRLSTVVASVPITLRSELPLWNQNPLRSPSTGSHDADQLSSESAAEETGIEKTPH